MNQHFENQSFERKISLKELILISQAYISFVSKKYITVLAFSICGCGMGYLFSSYSKLKYKSELRFVVKSEGSTSGLSSMLGGLGSFLGGSTMGSSLERTIEIAGSDRIVGTALLSKVQFYNNNEILANALIRLNNLHKDWRNDSLLKDVIFNDQDTSIENMSLAKRKAIKQLEALLIPKSGDGIIEKSLDKKSGVVTLSAVHESEEFSIVVTKAIFNKLRDFYVEQMVTSPSNNVKILQRKVDSIKFELSKVQTYYARNTDQSFGLLFQADKVELKKLAVREQMLMAMYAEAQKNLETFKFMNDSAIPSLTVIDMPYAPLKKIQKNVLLFSLSGFIFGGFISFLLLGIRYWYKNVMAS